MDVNTRISTIIRSSMRIAANWRDEQHESPTPHAGLQMFTSDVTLNWEIPRKAPGYAWAPCRILNWDARIPQEPDPHLALVWRDDAEFTTWHPLNESVALYRELAAVEPSPEGILKFASRYGLLGPSSMEVEA